MKKWITLTLSFCLTISIIAQPSFTEKTIDGNFDGAWDCDAIDMDGDGDMDVLGIAFNTPEIAWWENDGSQNFTKHTIDASISEGRGISAVDLNKDGHIDVLGALGSGNEIAWWENNGSQSFTKRSIDNSFNYARDILAADLDGDTHLDIISVSSTGNEIAWWKNNGTQSFSKNTISSSMGSPECVFTIDMDGDGDIDILSADASDDEIAWWENNGTGTFTKHSIDNTFDGTLRVHAIDLDRDGDIDVLGTAQYAQDLTWWENDGSQSFTEHTIKGNLAGALGVYPADMDGDGDIDILGTSLYTGIFLFENDGSQSFTEHNITSSHSSPYSILPVDMDSDGDEDFLSTAHTDDDITWWESDLTNQALDFDGTDDYVSLGAMDELENISQFTALGWFYFDGTANGERLITNQSSIGSDVGWGITLGGSGTGADDDIRFLHNVDGSSKGSVYTDGLGLTTGKWYHIAVVFDGTQATVADRVIIYINGKVQTNNFNGFDAPTSLPTTASPLVLGAKSDGSAGYFQGKMDEISLWRTALSETTIHDIMHTMITDTTNLEAYYRFHAAAGVSTFADYSEKGHVATWNGSGGTNTSSTLSTETYPFTYERMNNARAIWSTIGTDAALASDGFYASPTPALTGTQRHVYGHDNAGTGTTTDDLSLTDAASRFNQTWKVDGTLGLPASVYFNLSTITGTTVTAGTASDYVLLFRGNATGDFLQFNTGTSVNGDLVEFVGATLSPGYYTLGTKDVVNSPLPVEMLDFTGELQENNVLLEWQTAVEINNSHFDIEWSMDGFDFIKIGEERGAGTTNEAPEYEFIHDLNLVGLQDLRGLNSIYYRLRQVDFDGKYEYSKTISIQLGTGNGQLTTRIYPNPAAEFLTIENGNGKATIYNIVGQSIQQFLITDSEFTVDISILKQGQYFLQLQKENGEVETIKFLK